MNATNALGGSSGHQRTSFLTGVQLGLNFFGKVFCQHCDRRSASILFLTKICLILFTLFTLSGAVCRPATTFMQKAERIYSSFTFIQKVIRESQSERKILNAFFLRVVAGMPVFLHPNRTETNFGYCSKFQFRFLLNP